MNEETQIEEDQSTESVAAEGLIDPSSLSDADIENMDLENLDISKYDFGNEDVFDNNSIDPDTDSDFDVDSKESNEEDNDTAEDPDDVPDRDDADTDTGDSEQPVEDGELDSDNEDETVNPSEDITAENFMQLVTAPFKANGDEMQIRTPEEAIQLMKMGAGFTRKMQAIAPVRKMGTMLTREGITEQDLSLLIDVHKGDKTAIAKLLADKKFDTEYFDSEDQPEYQEKDYSVTDTELTLDDELDNIKSSPSYARTIDVVTNQWDQASKVYVGNNPKAISIINDQIEAGIYDVINAEASRQKALGGLTGMSDIEAYYTVGKELQSAGKLDEFANSKTNSSETDRKPAEKLKARKKAASSVKGKVPAKKQDLSQVNPFLMSDEDFEKTYGHIMPH